MPTLPQAFFARPTLTVARELLGQHLVREFDGQQLRGVIVETEAYIGSEDSANHASRGQTPRNAVMFGPAGYTYIYLIYGMHYMLNFITEQVDFPAAVLVRAIEPAAGQAVMQRHRQKVGRPLLKPKNLTNGPGKLCQALAIDKTLHNLPVGENSALWVEPGERISEADIVVGPRIGIDGAALEDRVAPWRFWVRGNRYVSRR